MINNPQDIESELKEITHYVHNAAARVHRGEDVDLSGLDRKVAAVCEKVEQSEPVAAKKLEPQFAELVGKLDDLAAAIKSRFDHLKGEQDSGSASGA